MVKDWSQDGTLWYNKLLFDKAKLPYPSSTTPMTYDEMLAIAKKLTVTKGGHTLIYGLSAPTWSVVGEVLQGMAEQGVSLFSADLTTADFTTPEAMKVLKFWADFGQLGVGNSFINPATDVNLYSGNTGMALLGYWYHGAILANNPKLLPHVGFAPAPQIGASASAPAKLARAASSAARARIRIWPGSGLRGSSADSRPSTVLPAVGVCRL